MCGIAGFVGSREHRGFRSKIKTVTEVLTHRGPDDNGWLVRSNGGLRTGRDFVDCPDYGDLFLLHRRLSILDLSPSGWQPLSTEDKRFWITFNGEIYNYIEIGKELKRLGYSFRTTTDTEVLLKAYVEWGAGCLNRFVGMFAFGILDTIRSELFVARDFYGIKPFYYSIAQNAFVFASEIKGILPHLPSRRLMDSTAVYRYLNSAVTDIDERTFFNDIKQIKPGHYARIPLENPTQVEQKCYWSVSRKKPERKISYQEASRDLNELFHESIRYHLRSDVPVCTTLSGGIDSSAITCVAKKILGEKPLTTFSYIADDTALNEKKYKDKVVKDYGLVSFETQVSAQELLNDLEKFLYCHDEPVSTTSMYAQYRVFQLIKEHGMKVVLDGQGADETLAGYSYFLPARAASLLRGGKWISAWNLLNGYSHYPDASVGQGAFLAARMLLTSNSASLLNRLAGINRRKGLKTEYFRDSVSLDVSFQSEGPDVLKERLAFSLTVDTIPRLLRFEDRNSMAASIESRVPFLTPSLTDYIYSLPEDFLISPTGETKHIFRTSMEGIVPASILRRTDKVGFGTPEKDIFKILKPWAIGVFHSDAAKALPFLDHMFVEREFNGYIENNKIVDRRCWRWLNIIKWSEQFSTYFE